MKPLFAGFSHRGLEVVGAEEAVRDFEAACVANDGHAPWTVVLCPPMVAKLWMDLQAQQRLVNSIKFEGGRVVVGGAA